MELSDDEENEDLVDAVAEREWRDVIKRCSKYAHDMCSINFPAFDGRSTHDYQIYTFAGFVRPGRHVIVIYDPKTKNFYRRDIVVEVRNEEIIVSQVKSLQETYKPIETEVDAVFKPHFISREEESLRLFKYDMNCPYFQ